ncbi:AraC family transcriptional regulator [Hymenobacter sp. UV11]|uniref:AraC family transcriptional regulator n=1 Tax=Hymenobacter sp. UV11 TaxID=1849735 RepID=UPI001060EAE5|nr:AraC family transcriptional regulator [Hymenobacter sp. UV11]TDN39672.1 AraC family transcriptional regulator [Hymenobacter sp. UV11]TFZ67208.1 AraC family transcriptional regulator [Hymenobacter sp. UV11]
MQMLTSRPPVPIYPFERDEATGSNSFSIARSAGGLPYEADVLLPHRKAYFMLVFTKHATGRHWVDAVPYVRQDRTLYFSTPSQLLVKEEPTPFWGTRLTFTSEFLALQQNAALRHLPLIQNPQNGHELPLTAADEAVVDDLLAKIEAEYQRPGEWQHQMLSAYLTVLLTYLSRLYTEQFPGGEPSADQRLLRTYRARIETHFHELHEVSAYAEMLHISAGHLSEVVKAQSGKSAIKHLHERLVLEAKRLLFYTPQSLKEIAFDLGFSDASYFNRFFKRETGLTPAEYRASIRKMYQ